MKKLICLFLLILGLASCNHYEYPFQNPNLSPEERAEDLISRLSIEQKALMMMNDSKGVDSLGVKGFQWWNEALHGTARNGIATVFPQTIGMAASFDNNLLYDVFSIASTEGRAKYNEAQKEENYALYHSVSFWTPNINIFRDPRWGRGQETYGEDPYLTAIMGTAVVNGLQGQKNLADVSNDKPEIYKAFACAKHFAIHSGPESERHSMSVDEVDPRDLYETYLPAFQTLVQKANVREVMCAYQSWDGEPCCSNNRLLEQILRKEWGFDGIIVSDCGAIDDIWMQGRHATVKTPSEATARGIGAGTDVNCGDTYTSLPEAIQKGQISEAKVNESLKRIIVGRILLGDFDRDKTSKWNNIGPDDCDTPESQQVALKMAHETMTLLQNRNNILPLKKDQKIAVMGQNANDSVMLWGNYNGFPRHTTTILDGIINKAGKENVVFVDGLKLVGDGFAEISHYDIVKTQDGKSGLEADMWNNTDMEGKPAVSSHFPSKFYFNCNQQPSIAAGINRDSMSVRLRGQLVPTATNDYSLFVAGDDGYRLILDGDTIISNWSRHSVESDAKTVRLEKGKKYDVVLEFYQGDGEAEFKFDVLTRKVVTNETAIAELGDIETVVYVGGLSPSLEGEEMTVKYEGFSGGDRTSIELPKPQRQLLADLHKAGKRIVFVNCSGSAIALEPEAENCDAILQAWYGGEMGGEAVADVLFGDYNPSGKLPVTFYKNDSQLPDFKEYSMKNRTYRYFQQEPLFPFGFGLSYTTFEIGEASLNGDKLVVPVKNTGAVEGDEVVQLYVKAEADTDGPRKALRGFERISLKPGETKNVTFDITKERLEYFDTQSNTMRAVPGNYTLSYGNSSAAPDLKQISYTLK